MLKTKEEIENWLKKMEIPLYDVRIHDNLVVDVRTNLNLDRKDLKEIPIQFGVVSGNLNVHYNLLTSLSFVKEVNQSIIAIGNQLQTLENFPIVHGSVELSYNKLKSLKGLPKEIKGSLNLEHNELTSLQYCPEKIDNVFKCGFNPLNSLNYLPKEVGLRIVFYGLKIDVLKENFDHINDYNIIVLDLQQDKTGELSEFYEQNEICLPLEDLKRYQFKKILEHNLTEKLEVNKPKI